MAEVRTAPVKAQRVDDIDDARVHPGTFEYTRVGDRYPGGMIYACPCGCGRTSSLIFRPVPPAFAPRASWEWDGNTEAPTLTPSVHHGGHWHGWLRNGFWISV